MNYDRLCYGCFCEKEGDVCPHCGYVPSADNHPFLALPLGTILAGRYMTGKVLGMGGFGITYLGFDLTLQIKVAIKEFMPQGLATRGADRYATTLLSSDQEPAYRAGAERFLEEARILAKLRNTPGVVSVQNYFYENNTAYFVMDYVDGLSLKEYVAQHGGRIPYEQAIGILMPVMQALEQVHALGLLHRDISPDNIYITSSGQSMLLDFGAARFALDGDKSLSVILKHGFAPEEQYRSHGNQGPWTDVYALGATLYNCITGLLPPDSIDRLHNDTLTLPSALGIAVPPYAEQALCRALAVRPEIRFASMDQMVAAFNGQPVAPPAGPFSAAQPTMATPAAGYGTSGASPAAYGAPVYAGAPPAKIGILQRLKNEPKLLVIVCVATVLLLLAIILPIVLLLNHLPRVPLGEGGIASIPSSSSSSAFLSSGESAASDTSESTASSSPAAGVEIVSYTSDALGLYLEAPAYCVVEESTDLLTVTDPNDHYGIVTYFTYYYNKPLYGLDDFFSDEDYWLDTMLLTEAKADDYAFTDEWSFEQGDTVGYIYEGKISSSSGGETYESFAWLCIMESQNGYGCYFMLCLHDLTDPDFDQNQELFMTMVDSVLVVAPYQTSMELLGSEELGFHLILDSGAYPGGSEMGDGLMLFPLADPSTARVMIEEIATPLLTPEEALQAYIELMADSYPTADVYDPYEVTYNEQVYQVQELSYTESGISMQIGFCATRFPTSENIYAIAFVCLEEDIDTTTDLVQLVMTTLRPWPAE